MKMGKFRKWLIHRLGGILSEDIKSNTPIIKTKTIDLIPFEVVLECYEWKFSNEEDAKKYCENILCYEIAEKLKPYISFHTMMGKKFVRAEIKIPAEFVNNDAIEKQINRYMKGEKS